MRTFLEYDIQSSTQQGPTVNRREAIGKKGKIDNRHLNSEQRGHRQHVKLSRDPYEQDQTVNSKAVDKKRKTAFT